MNPTPVDIISGFLGAGKTTFIKHLFTHFYQGKKISVIENDFGDVGIDGRVLGKTGSKVTEINSGCICCTLVLDFQSAIETAAADPEIDRIVIEPSGVAKLSDVLRACRNVVSPVVRFGMVNTVVDALSYGKYADGFGAFFLDQVRNAERIFVSKTQETGDDQVRIVSDKIRLENPEAEIITLPWDSQEFFNLLAGLPAEAGPVYATTADTAGAAASTRDHEHSDVGFESIRLEISGGHSAEGIRSALRRLTAEKKLWEGGRIIRIKGILSAAQETVQVDWVHGSFDVVPVELPAGRELVVIGKDIPREYLRGLFALP